MRYFYNGTQLFGAWTDSAGFKYPANWCELATSEDLARVGVTALPDLEPPQPTQEELMHQASEAVRFALQSAIDSKAVSLGFSSGNALMLYAGFTNAFQSLAQTFATWEASVWVEANEYKAEVLAGTKPMLTGDEAVAMMPIYPTT